MARNEKEYVVHLCKLMNEGLPFLQDSDLEIPLAPMEPKENDPVVTYMFEKNNREEFLRLGLTPKDFETKRSAALENLTDRDTAILILFMADTLRNYNMFSEDEIENTLRAIQIVIDRENKEANEPAQTGYGDSWDDAEGAAIRRKLEHEERQANYKALQTVFKKAKAFKIIRNDLHNAFRSNAKDRLLSVFAGYVAEKMPLEQFDDNPRAQPAIKKPTMIHKLSGDTDEKLCGYNIEYYNNLNGLLTFLRTVDEAKDLRGTKFEDKLAKAVELQKRKRDNYLIMDARNEYEFIGKDISNRIHHTPFASYFTYTACVFRAFWVQAPFNGLLIIIKIAGTFFNATSSNIFSKTTKSTITSVKQEKRLTEISEEQLWKSNRAKVAAGVLIGSLVAAFMARAFGAGPLGWMVITTIAFTAIWDLSKSLNKAMCIVKNQDGDMPEEEKKGFQTIAKHLNIDYGLFMLSQVARYFAAPFVAGFGLNPIVTFFIIWALPTLILAKVLQVISQKDIEHFKNLDMPEIFAKKIDKEIQIKNNTPRSEQDSSFLQKYCNDGTLKKEESDDAMRGKRGGRGERGENSTLRDESERSPHSRRARSLGDFDD